MHKLCCPARPHPLCPPSRPPFDQTQALTSLKTPPSPHRLFDSQDSLDKRMHFFQQQLSDFDPLRNGFIVSAHRLTNIALLTLTATLSLQGEPPTCILNEETQPIIRGIRASHAACKGEFRQKNILSHSWSVFVFL